MALEPLYIHKKGIRNKKEKGGRGWQWKQGVGD